MNGLVNSRSALGVALCLFALLNAVSARTIYVDDDRAAEFHTIAAAVDAARSGDVIVVARGRYTGGDNRDILIAGKTLTIRSADPNDPATVAATVIDCQGSEANACRAFEVSSDGQSRLMLAGLTIVNGRHAHAGGAVLCEGESLDVLNCTFTDNRAPWWGGAIYCADSDVTLQGCTFFGNVSESLHGGAIFVKGTLLHLANCTFEENTGSAIESSDSALTLTDCIFQDNTGQDGGAIHGYAGADMDMATSLSMTGCTFIGNVANGSGGALYNRRIAATLEGCTFTANLAGQDGGAVYIYGASPLLTNCVFVGNTAVTLGGAMANCYASRPDVFNCTFVANAAAGGGAIASRRDSHALISHSILWQNTAGRGNQLYLGRYEWGTVQIATTTVEYSDVEGGQADVYVEPGCVLNWAAGNIDAVPLFTGPVQDDYHLSPDSPCINAGDPGYLPDPGATDLDGNPRQFGTTVDMGAYEFQGLGPIYRFWSPTKSKHFYTISGAERDKLVDKYPHVWEFEDIAYYAFYRPTQANLVPVHRFWSDKERAHFWTISEAERQKVATEFAELWTYEGVVFYAYPERKQPLGTMPIYRFWSSQLGHHFYTMDENEKDKLIVNYPKTWTFEGVAWYAYAKSYQPQKAAYEFTGGADEAWYILTLSAYIDGKQAEIDVPSVELIPTTTQMRMTIDFIRLTTTLDELHVQTALMEHAATIKEPGPAGLMIPFVLSAQASFDMLTQRGPFAIDAETGVFADFVSSNQDLVGKDSSFVYSGSVVLDGRVQSFSRKTAVTRFELETSGTFEALRLLPEGINARTPFTFQWHRQYVKDLLAEASVGGHLVQIYVIYTYVSAQGLWQGQIAE